MTQLLLSKAIADCAQQTEAFLKTRLAALAAPDRLISAMRHGSLNGGKRLRPFLLQQSAALFGIAPEKSLAAGAALELVHCYSLVHDDLPDMDDDEMRRGQPTVWKAFDPALAILSGDALLTEAFALLADPATHSDPAIRAELISTVALGSGANGMVGGQVLDIEGETTPLDEAAIFKMQAMKTGALIRTAAEMGAILGEADENMRANIVLYGISAGLAFQLADDILDVTASSAQLGKTAGKDIEQNKSTIVALRGLDTAREILDGAVSQGLHALEQFGPEADMLRALIHHFATREN